MAVPLFADHALSVSADDLEGDLPETVRADGLPAVLHLITSLDRGGAENYLLALLSHSDTSRYRMEVAVLRGEGELTPEFQAAGIPLHHLRARAGVDPFALGRLRRLIKGGSFDVVHSHLFRADLYAAVAIAALGDQRPLLFSTRHNDDRFFLNPFVGILHYLVSGHQDTIIAISDHVARFTIARGVRYPERVRRVYHGLDPRNEAAESRERMLAREELGIPGDAYLVGNVGRLAPQKGQRHLVSAMPLLLEHVPWAHAVIAGGGDLAPRLRDLAAELGVSDRVHVLGPRRDVPAIMQAIDVFAMPSMWEGFGIVLLEAMAAARPIVASRVATIPEVVLDGETGLLVPPADAPALAEALRTLAHDRVLAERLGQAGRARLETRFSLQKMVADTELLYDEALAR